MRWLINKIIFSDKFSLTCSMIIMIITIKHRSSNLHLVSDMGTVAVWSVPSAGQIMMLMTPPRAPVPVRVSPAFAMSKEGGISPSISSPYWEYLPKTLQHPWAAVRKAHLFSSTLPQWCFEPYCHQILLGCTSSTRELSGRATGTPQERWGETSLCSPVRVGVPVHLLLWTSQKCSHFAPWEECALSPTSSVSAEQWPHVHASQRHLLKAQRSAGHSSPSEGSTEQRWGTLLPPSASAADGAGGMQLPGPHCRWVFQPCRRDPSSGKCSQQFPKRAEVGTLLPSIPPSMQPAPQAHPPALPLPGVPSPHPVAPGFSFRFLHAWLRGPDQVTEKLLCLASHPFLKRA